jgi:NADH-quinone oxidoreductase subunit L
LPHALGGSNQFGAWLEPLIKTHGTESGELQIGTPTAEYALMVLSILVAFIGIYLAKKWYLDKSETPASLSKTGFHNLLYNKYWVDQIYDTVISKPLVKASEINSKYVDTGIIDGFYRGLATFFYFVGSVTRRMQTGALHDYLVFMAGGLVLVLGVFLFTL